jgi:hypothetical protein
VSRKQKQVEGNETKGRPSCASICGGWV